jgi:hypothetical protein
MGYYPGFGTLDLSNETRFHHHHWLGFDPVSTFQQKTLKEIIQNLV